MAEYGKVFTPDASSIVEWNKVADIKFATDVFSGIIAVGQSGICNPIEGGASFRDTGFLSCAPYFNGDILIAENTTIIETYESKSENKWPYDIIDVATIGTITYIIDRFGNIFYSTEFGKFSKSLIKYDTFNSINQCDPYFVMSGKRVIVINDSREPNRNTFTNVTINDADFKSAYVYDNCKLVALTGDNKIIYMPDFKDISKIYSTSMDSIIPVSINQIYVYNNNLYLLCKDGFIILIKSFELSDENNDLDIYASRFSTTDWRSMIHLDDDSNRTIVVGKGRLDKSILKIVNFDDYLINNDLLTTTTVKRSYPHLMSMMDSYENGCVAYTFHDIRPTIDALDNRYVISLKTLLSTYNGGLIDNPDQLEKIDWRKSSVYVVIADPNNPDVLYDWKVDENGTLTISIDKLTNGTVNILLMLRGDKS